MRKKEQIELAKKAMDTLKKLFDLTQKMEDVEEDEEERIFDEVTSDYNSFFKWALGIKNCELVDIEEAKKTWEQVHPELPVPRICFLKNKLPQLSFTILFLMDAYPLYLQHKNK